MQNFAWTRLLVIVVVLVCVAGVLILPQVDLPDFVVQSSRGTVMSLLHSSNGFYSILKSSLGVLSGHSQPGCVRSKAARLLEAFRGIDVQLVLTQLCTHRC